MHFFSQIIIDFGLVVFIWTVQLVIYPSFHYFNKAGLKKWHLKYKVLITFIVLPLMFGQVALHGLKLWDQFEILRVAQLVMITLVWVITFAKAVPLHTRMDHEEHLTDLITQLVNWNWPRTVLWSSVFVINFF